MSAAPAPHVVLGAGAAGTALAAELIRRGHHVHLVNRSGTGPAIEGVHRYAADVNDVEQVRSLVAGAEVVYHCVNVAYHEHVKLLPGIQESILAAAEAEATRLVVLDNLYPYGETGEAIITEDTPWRATTDKGSMRARLDENYLSAHREGRARVVIGRAADFIGPGVVGSSLGGAVFPAALTGGQVVALGNIDLPHSYSFIGDVAAGLATLGEHPEADGEVWHLPTAAAPTTRHVHTMIERRLGQPLDVVALSAAQSFGSFDATVAEAYAEMFYQHTQPQIMDSTAFETTFGLQPTPTGAAVAETLDWYRAWLGMS
ncbi:NAD-dependent epimerase/dehydratase family protein [Salinactinospora qingdaonensis]|uniref:SDR family oxidoreductase n=1 Tax=Salinactinospora qingdaonensis TaxID=702744 RepID=A0ABP7G2I9_9ACTN